MIFYSFIILLQASNEVFLVALPSHLNGCFWPQNFERWWAFYECRFSGGDTIRCRDAKTLGTSACTRAQALVPSLTPEPPGGTFTIFTARKRSLRRLCFYRCVSVHRGGGMRGRGGGRGVGGMRGRGACMVGGQVCMAGGHVGGMHGGGHACPPTHYETLRSMRARYASYWNAFLF